MADDSVNHAFVMKVSCKTSRWKGPESFQVSEYMEVLGGQCPREEMEVPVPTTPYLALRIPSIWLFLGYILYNKLEIFIKMLSWVLGAILANSQTWGGGCGTPPALQLSRVEE